MDYSLNLAGTILSLLFLIMEACAAILFFDSFFNRKVNNLKLSIICAVRISIVFIINETFPFSILFKILFIAFRFLESLLLYDGSAFKKLLCSSIVTTFFGIFDEVSFAIVEIVLNTTYADLLESPLLYTSIVILQKLLLIFSAYLFKLLHRKDGMHFLPLSAILSPILFSSASSIFIIIFAYSVSSSSSISVLGGLCIVIFVAVSNVSLIYLLTYLETSAKEKVILQLLKREEKIQLDSINALKEAYSVQRKASHEFNRHMNMICSLLSENHPVEALEYAKKVSNAHVRYSQTISTHHTILDAIFNQKYAFAKSNGIEMEFQINDLSAVNIPNHYLVVLLCNLIDNAIEACCRLESSRVIQIKMLHLNDSQEILICIRNTSPLVHIHGTSIQTTKASKSEHGYGLPTVSNILHELHTDCVLDYDNGWFQFTTIISNPPAT